MIFVHDQIELARALCYNTFQYILKQWIGLKARADWFVKLRISYAIYLRATREKMASRLASVTSEEMIQIIFAVYIISLFQYILKQLFTSVSVVSGCYLPRRFAARQISTSNHLHFGEQLLIIASINTIQQLQMLC